MKLLKSILVIVVAVALLLWVGGMIVPNLGAHIKAKGESMADKLNHQASLAELVSIAEQKVRDAREEVKRYHFEVSKCEVEAEIQAAKLADLRKEKENKSNTLLLIRERFQNHPQGKVFLVGNPPKEISWSVAKQNVVDRVNELKVLDQHINEKASLLSRLQADINTAKVNLDRSVAKIQGLKAKIDEWKARIAAKEVEVKVNEITAAIHGDPLADDTDLVNAFSALQDRYLELEAKTRVAKSSALPSEGESAVPWEEEFVEHEDVLNVIDGYFNTQTTEQIQSEPEEEAEEQDTMPVSPTSVEVSGYSL